jgi:cytoskeletal protein RodZ
MSLEALERSDLSRLPGGIFTRAFIRAYAQEVGLDPDRTIQDFIAELPAETATPAGRSSSTEDNEGFESDRKAAATAARLILVSLPIIALVTYYGTHRTPASPDAAPGVASSSGTTRAAAAASELTAAETASHQRSSGLTLEMAPLASCWVSVTADGELIFSGLMNKGDKRVVNAKEQILMNVGDAGAFGYILNGVEGRPLGAPGQVVSKRITLSNLHEFAIP